jgi:hypothetical protein
MHALGQNQDERADHLPQKSAGSRPARRKISLVKPPPTPSQRWRCRHHRQAKPQIPIDQRAQTAGSYLGGFRTPANTKTHDLRWPASENLHQLSYSRPHARMTGMWPITAGLLSGA